MEYPPVENKSVLVTGCSSGIGAATAHVLREAGWRVIPTARKDADLERLKREGFEPLALDLSDSSSVQAASSELLGRLVGQLGALVNNAGFAQVGAVEDVGREALRQQFEVNVFGLQELTNSLIPAFRGQGWGRIVNISSVYGRITAPMAGSYCASKYALEALSDAMRIELRGSGVAVSIVEPGPIVTSFRKNAAAQASASLNAEESRFGAMYEKEVERRKKQLKRPDLFTRPPEEVAVKIRHALESRRPKVRYCVTIPAYVGVFASRFLPASLRDRMLARKLP